MRSSPSLIAPPALRPGERIAICAPSGPVPQQAFAAGLARLTGFDLSVPPSLHRKSGFLAGSDEERADEFNRALRDPDVRCIWAARGGYGAHRIAPLLDADALHADPIPIVGFSDITVLLSWAVGVGVMAVHAPVITQLGSLPGEDLAAAVAMLTGADIPPRKVSGADGAEGRLLGGNLSVLSHLVGTPWQVPCAGAVLFVEDVGERPYRIDRYLTHLALGGGLADATAIALGTMTRCEPQGEGGPSAEAVVAERAAALGLPLCTGLLSGHGERNAPLPFGGQVRIGGGELHFLHGPVTP